jgi:hypothetical protein
MRFSPEDDGNFEWVKIEKDGDNFIISQSEMEHLMVHCYSRGGHSALFKAKQKFNKVFEGD